MNKWSTLNDSKKEIITKVKEQWISLIDNESTNEHNVHEFIDNHSGLFFGTNEGFAISKVKLSDEYITDLVILRDKASYGFEYELIELESPRDKTFTQKGNQSANLTEAIQQIEDWQRWIQNHLESSKKLFPSKKFNLTHIPQIKYTVIIGRREELGIYDNKRFQKTSNSGIEIRSFDYLTDKLSRNFFTDEPYYELIKDNNSSIKKIGDNEIYKLISPFRKSMSYSSWKKIIQSNKFYESHSAGWNWELFLEHVKNNEALLSEFNKS